MVLTSAASVGAELVSADGLGETLASMDGLGEAIISPSAAVLADGLGEVFPLTYLPPGPPLAIWPAGKPPAPD